MLRIRGRRVSLASNPGVLPVIQLKLADNCCNVSAPCYLELSSCAVLHGDSQKLDNMNILQETRGILLCCHIGGFSCTCRFSSSAGFMIRTLLFKGVHGFDFAIQLWKCLAFVKAISLMFVQQLFHSERPVRELSE
jgi:hypothetical protein